MRMARGSRGRGLAAAAGPGHGRGLRSRLELRDRWLYLTANLAEPASWVGDTQRFYYRTVPAASSSSSSTRRRWRSVLRSITRSSRRRSRKRPARPTRRSACRSTTSGSRPMSGRSRWASPAGSCRAAWPTTSAQPRQSAAWQRPSAAQLRRGARSRRCRPTTGRSDHPTARGKRSSRTTTSSSARPAKRNVTILSTDGSEGNFYDPESIVWSPDSKKIAAYRVRARLSPAGALRRVGAGRPGAAPTLHAALFQARRRR